MYMFENTDRRKFNFMSKIPAILCFILFFILAFSFSFLVLGETIVLYSGKVIKGEMLDMRAEDIILNVDGKAAIYKLEDIKTIDGKKFRLPPKIGKGPLTAAETKKESSPKEIFSPPKYEIPQDKKPLFGPRKKTKISLDKKIGKKTEPARKGNLNDARSYFQIGYLHASLGEEEQASDSYAKALKIKPDLGQFYLDEGLTQTHLGNRREARENIQKAMELFKFSKDFQRLSVAEDYLQQLY